MNRKMEDMASLISKLISNQGRSAGDDQTLHTLDSYLPQENSNARSVVDDEVLQAQTSTPQVQRKRKSKDSVCMLLHLRSRLVVAHGQLVSDDPKCMMHNKVLGPNAVKVSVTRAILPATPLWRLTDDADTIGEALNGFIAWPKDRIVMKDD